MSVRPWSLGLLAVVLTVATSTGAAQSPVALRDLTVPPDRLPAGCGLTSVGRDMPATPGRPTIRVFEPWATMLPPSATGNPWVGADVDTLAWLRQRVDGSREARWPDAPPLTNAQQAEQRQQLAEGVEEGYAATYSPGESRDLLVYAVRFAAGGSRRLSFAEQMTPTPHLSRVELGAVSAVLYGDGGPCSKAIETHLRSLGR